MGTVGCIPQHPQRPIAPHHSHIELPVPIEVGRYHSLAANRDKMPPELVVTARTTDGEIMGVRHTTLNVQGVQFHPESVLTPEGPHLLQNFLTP